MEAPATIPKKRRRPKIASRWIRCAADERAIAEGCTFREELGEYVCDFFPKFMRHYEGDWAGRPFELLDWQIDKLIMPLFSWVRPDGSRRFRFTYWEVAKKNGKTSLVAGLGGYGLIADGEEGAKVFSAACTKDQASYTYEFLSSSLRMSDELRERVFCIDSLRRINYPATNSHFRALPSDAGTNEGLNASMILADEIHAWNPTAGRKLWESLKYAGRARRQPLIIVITTAGDDINGIGHDLYATACRIRDSELDQTDTHVAIFEADPKAAIDDPKAWAAANPSLGVTIKVEDIRADAEAAIKSPDQENTFRRRRLNQWVSTFSRWISTAAWAVCDALEFDDASLIGKRGCAGLDLGQVNASSALVAAFPLDDGTMALKAAFFLPEDGIVEKEQHDQAPYRRWADLGYYTLTPGPVTDYEFVKQTIREWCEIYKLGEIAFDPYHTYELAPALESEGLPMKKFPQGWEFISPASKEFERLLLAGKIRANHNPVLRWMSGNVVAKIGPSGNIRPHAGASKLYIDGIVASVMAVARALTLRPKESVYLTRGPIVLGQHGGTDNVKSQPNTNANR